MNIYQACLDRGVEIDNNRSDLLIPVNEVTKELVSNYIFCVNVTTFTNNLDGKLWFSIPFAYMPFWEARSMA